MWVPLVKPFCGSLISVNYFSVSPAYNNAGQCKPKADGSGFGLPALSFMRGRSNPPSFYAIDFLPADAYEPFWLVGSGLSMAFKDLSSFYPC
jgi:hypothetical protein